MKNVLFVVVFLTLSLCSYAQDCTSCQPQSGPCDCSDSCGGGYVQPEYVGECGYECCQPCIYVPCFYGRADAVLWNIGGNNRSLVLRDVNGSNQTAFSSEDFSNSIGGSARILLGVNLTACTGIEGQYNGFQEWQSTKTLTGNGNLFLPGALGAATNDFFMADKMTLFSEVDFHSAEINLVRRTRNPSLVWLAGFRYINFEENFNLNSTIDIRAPWYSSDYTTRTANNLYGGQLGAKWDCLLTERFGLQAVGKVGVYGNNAKQQSWMGDDNNMYELRNVNMKGTKTSWGSELNLGGYFRVTENVSITGGYNLMWISDIARGADQLDFGFLADSGKHIATDTLFMHGANVGIEWQF